MCLWVLVKLFNKCDFMDWMCVLYFIVFKYILWYCGIVFLICFIGVVSNELVCFLNIGCRVIWFLLFNLVNSVRCGGSG